MTDGSFVPPPDEMAGRVADFAEENWLGDWAGGCVWHFSVSWQEGRATGGCF